MKDEKEYEISCENAIKTGPKQQPDLIEFSPWAM
jgi:hypothetical protein